MKSEGLSADIQCVLGRALKPLTTESKNPTVKSQASAQSEDPATINRPPSALL
jgi:hypothetical protein